MLSERSQLQVTTTVTQSSQDLVPQDPNSLPVSGGLTPKDSSNIDNVTSFPHNAVVEIEETVYQINQTYPTSTEHLESIDLELAASEESQLRGSQGIDYVAADKSIQSGVDNELKLHDEAMNSNRDHLPEPKLYDETVQVEDGVEQVDNLMLLNHLHQLLLLVLPALEQHVAVLSYTPSSCLG